MIFVTFVYWSSIMNKSWLADSVSHYRTLETIVGGTGVAMCQCE